MLDGFSTGGRNTNSITCTDDTVLVANSEDKLQALLGAVNPASEEKGLRINKEKPEY